MCASFALEPDIASKTVVLCRRPSKTFYMQCRLRKWTKCIMYIVIFLWLFAPGLIPPKPRALSLRNLVSGYESGRVFPAGVGPGSPSRDAAN